MELDAIAAVVIGGTLLTGGSGYLIGRARRAGARPDPDADQLRRHAQLVVDKIFIATLLLAFILLQRLVFARGKMGGLSRGAAA